MQLFCIQVSRIATAMFSRLRAQPKSSSHRQMDDEERLLSTIELQDYPIDPTTNASPRIYHTSESDTSALRESLQIYPHETSTRNRLHRVATSLKLSRCRDGLIGRLQSHSRNKWVVLPHSEELESGDQVNTDSKTLLGKGHGKSRSRRAKLVPDSDRSLRSTVDWYFWSPTNTAKNCPTLEFLLLHLAPSHIWL